MTTLTLDYNLDVAGAATLDDALTDVAAEEQCTVDLTDVAFVASSGLRILLKHGQRLDAAGGKLVIANPNAVVAEVFEMTGFDQILAIEHDG